MIIGKQLISIFKPRPAIPQNKNTQQKKAPTATTLARMAGPVAIFGAATRSVTAAKPAATTKSAPKKKGFFASIGGAFASVGKAIGGAVTKVVTKTVDAVKGIGKAITDIPKTVKEAFTPPPGASFGEALWHGVKAPFKVIGSVAKVGAAAAKAVLTPAFTVAGEVLKPVVAGAKWIGEKTGLSKVLAPIGKALAPVGRAIGKVLAPVMKVYDTVMAPFREVLGPITEPFGDAITDLTAGFPSPLNKAGKFVGDIVGDPATWVEVALTAGAATAIKKLAVKGISMNLGKKAATKAATRLGTQAASKTAQQAARKAATKAAAKSYTNAAKVATRASKKAYTKTLNRKLAGGYTQKAAVKAAKTAQKAKYKAIMKNRMANAARAADRAATRSLQQSMRAGRRGATQGTRRAAGAQAGRNAGTAADVINKRAAAEAARNPHRIKPLKSKKAANPQGILNKSGSKASKRRIKFADDVAGNGNSVKKKTHNPVDVNNGVRTRKAKAAKSLDNAQLQGRINELEVKADNLKFQAEAARGSKKQALKSELKRTNDELANLVKKQKEVDARRAGHRAAINADLDAAKKADYRMQQINEAPKPRRSGSPVHVKRQFDMPSTSDIAKLEDAPKPPTSKPSRSRKRSKSRKASRA